VTLEATEFTTEAQLWNAIVRQFGTPLPLPAGHVVLTEAEPPEGAVASYMLNVGPDIALTLVLLDFPFARLTGVDLSLTEVTALPAALAEGLQLGAVEALRAALPPAFAAHLTLPQQSGAKSKQPLWLAAQIDIGSGALAQCRIGGRRQDFVQVLARLFPASATQTARLPVALLEGLATTVAIAAGEAILPLAVVTALEPGDVVLADVDADQRSFRVGQQDVLLAAAPTDSPDAAPRWSVKEFRMTTENAEADALSLDDVPLTLRFVTEDQRITLAELQGLAAGSILPFDVTPLAAGLPVRIQANGVTIGDGHLVQIDDSYAVRVSRMVPKGS
jgi:type III secretion system YscQ/HrcQ family protein